MKSKRLPRPLKAKRPRAPRPGPKGSGRVPGAGKAAGKPGKGK